MMPKSPSEVRTLTLSVLEDVLEHGRFASEKIDEILTRHPLIKKDRALLTQLVYGILREKAFLDGVISSHLKKKKTSPALANILRLGVYQIMFLEKVPEHAAIFESVEIAKRVGGSMAANFVNAVLRQVQRTSMEEQNRREKTLAELSGKGRLSRKELGELSRALSFPEWLLARWQKRYGTGQAIQMIRSFNSPPPTYLRVNIGRISIKEALDRLAAVQIQAGGISETPILRLKSYPHESLGPLLRAGLLSVQDLGSYRVVEALKAQYSETGLDACSGHGGKLSAIVEHLGNGPGTYAYEPVEAKREELRDNFRRLGLPCPELLSDWEEARARGLSFDWILVDAPCSGLGTLRRKPEIRWRIHPGDLPRFQKKQLEILDQWAPFLKDTGRLLYSVCSLEPEEGREVINIFCREHKDFQMIEAKEMLPFQVDQDGFFLARLIRKR